MMKVLRSDLKLNILGAARALPEGPAVSNLDLLLRHPETAGKPRPVLEELDARIARGFGFKTRYMTHAPGAPLSGAEETSESLALKACQKAVALGREQVTGEIAPEAFILGTTTARRYTGSQAASVLGKLGAFAPAYEIKAGCSTSLASLHLAQALIFQGYDNVLVSCAETLSKVVHPEVRETWFGLADGAAALWIERGTYGGQFEVLKTVYSTDGRYVDLYTTPGDLPPRADILAQHGYCLSGDGSQLKEHAKKRYLEMIEALLPTAADRKAVKWIIPHQVNRLLIDEVCKEAKLDGELIWSAQEFGNLGGTSVLFSLAQAIEEKRIRGAGDILLMSVGGGLSFAAQVWRNC